MAGRMKEKREEIKGEKVITTGKRQRGEERDEVRMG